MDLTCNHLNQFSCAPQKASTCSAEASDCMGLCRHHSSFTRPDVYVVKTRRKSLSEGTHLVSVSFDVLKNLFKMTAADAARECGICLTTFKKACRFFGIYKWPFRHNPDDRTHGMASATHSHRGRIDATPSSPAAVQDRHVHFAPVPSRRDALDNFAAVPARHVHFSPMPARRDALDYFAPMPARRDALDYFAPMPARRDALDYFAPMPARRDALDHFAPMPARHDALDHFAPMPARRDALDHFAPMPARHDALDHFAPMPARHDALDHFAPMPARHDDPTMPSSPVVTHQLFSAELHAVELDASPPPPWVAITHDIAPPQLHYYELHLQAFSSIFTGPSALATQYDDPNPFDELNAQTCADYIATYLEFGGRCITSADVASMVSNDWGA